mgnify:CR=1 FL=1
MTEIWPREVSRKFKSENRFEFSPKREGGKIPARHTGCRPLGRPPLQGVDMGVDPWVDPPGRTSDLVHLLLVLARFWRLVTIFEGSDLS